MEFLSSEKASLEKENVSLKDQLADYENKITSQESAMQKEKQRHLEMESKLKLMVDTFDKTQKEAAKEMANSERTKVELGRVCREVQMYKEQLQENDEYIKSLEQAMDEQLALWEKEEEKAQHEIEQKFLVVSRFKSKEKELQQQLQRLKQQLADARHELKEKNALKNTIVLERKQLKKVEAAANMNEVKYQRSIQQLENENDKKEGLQYADQRLTRLIDAAQVFQDRHRFVGR